MTRFGVIRGSRICCAGSDWSKNCLAFGESGQTRPGGFRTLVRTYSLRLSRKMCAIRLYPSRPNSKYAPYKEAWHLLH